jgi:hypothetical protein
MMNKQWLLQFFILGLLQACFSMPIQAQSGVGNVDSLRNCLTTQTDTVRLKTLGTLENLLKDNHPQEAYAVAKEMLDLAISIKAPRRIARAYNALGLISVKIVDYDKGVEYDSRQPDQSIHSIQKQTGHKESP